MNNPILSLSTWVSLPNEVRYRIRELFSIPRSGNTIVHDGAIETDGTTYDDFKELTIEKMQKYVLTESTDFHKLFEMVVNKIQNEIDGILPPISEPTKEEPKVEQLVVIKKKKNEKKK